MAVELVAGAFLSAVFDKLFEQLTSPEFRKNSVASKLKELEGKLKKAKYLLDDAEDRQVNEPSVKEWLDELKHIVFMVDDLVEEIRNKVRSKKEGTEFGRKSVTRAIKTVYHSLTKTVQGEIDAIFSDLDNLLDRAPTLGLKHGGDGAMNSSNRSSPSVIPPLRDEHHVYGRNADKEKIFDLLLSNDVWGGKIGVLPIVGMGGLGKTTLSQLVYDDPRVKEHAFMLKAWVTVSTEFDAIRIMKAILQQVNPEAPKDGVDEPSQLQRLMKEAMTGKRFLFVLDDVWDENYDNWDVLMSNFTSGDCRSRVIVTTRSKDVGSMVKTGPVHELEPVSNEDCWSIFFQHALNGDTNADPQLQEIGRRIVEKCKGLPLAVKSIGGLLRSEKSPQKWETVLRSHVWEWSKSQGSGVLPSLWLSYRYLPSSLKQCFAYCSLFPQDYEFDKKEMVLLWMAEGFLQSEEKMEEVGEQYFDELISRSLFQRSSQDEYVMHDLFHDLAVFVSGEFCFRFEKESLSLKNLTTRTRYFSHNTRIDDGLWTSSFSTAKHLRTFMNIDPYLCADKFIKDLTKARHLRVLSVLTLYSHSIGDLKSLRYLNLSDSTIEEIPSSVCTLFNLQTLVLRYCLYLQQLPVDMKMLINLRHLDTAGTELTQMPPQMGNLKELRTLTKFILGEAHGTGCSKIKELGELQHLGGTLCISELQNVESVEDAKMANLRNKAEIKELVLEWEGDVIDTREVHVLDALQPHTNLEKLAIKSYSGSSFPIWVCEPSFSKMVSVELNGKHDFCRSLPPLGQLPFLKNLEIKSFNGVESIGSEFYGINSSITSFPSLETLAISYMESWKEWSFAGCFPRLKEFFLKECPKLVGSLFDCKTLEYLSISHSYESMECFQLEKFPIMGKLYLGGFRNLKSLVSTENKLPSSLITLEISNCPEIESFPEIETLQTLEILHSYNSMECFPLDKFPRLKTLYLNGCPNLKSLTSNTEDSFFLSLTTLKICDCPEIELLTNGGSLSNLNSLEIVECTKLVKQNRHWDLQKLTSLSSLSIYDSNVALDSFPEGLLPISLTSLTLGGFPHLRTLNGISFQNVKSLRELYIGNCKKLESLPEQVLPTSLCSLRIGYCPILERRYRKTNGAEWHNISHIPQIEIRGSTTYKLDKELDS